MPEFEYGRVDPDDFADELEEAVRRRREDKYAFQVGLADLDFDVDHARAEELDVSLPFESIQQAEQALWEGIITPTEFLEVDGTTHQVEVFDHVPVGFSGFQGTVTHSLALTDQGMFEVGRYPAVSLRAAFEGEAQPRYWQWFLHRRLAVPEQVATWQEEADLSARHVVDLFYETLTGIPKPREEESPFRFTLGRTVQTPGAQEAFEEAGQHPMDFIRRHITGDWGELSDFDKEQNEIALSEGLRLLSAYILEDETKIWIITEADRSVTTLLLPEEY